MATHNNIYIDISTLWQLTTIYIHQHYGNSQQYRYINVMATHNTSTLWQLTTIYIHQRYGNSQQYRYINVMATHNNIDISTLWQLTTI